MEGRLQQIAWTVGGQDVLSHTYGLDARSRRTLATREDGSHWDYGYNPRGEVTGGAQKWQDGSLLPGRGFGYSFDAIGNRTLEEVTFATPPSARTTDYTTNALNQYTDISRSNPLRRIIQGVAHPDATVEVTLDGPGGQPVTVARVAPGGAGFVSEAAAEVSLGGAWRFVRIDATRPGVGVNGGTVHTQREGWLFFGPQNETLSYDLDGNLVDDARWHYTWDGENRLIAMEEKAIPNASPNLQPPARQRLEFVYDNQSRRIRKVVKTFSPQTSSFSLVSDIRFVYDDWNLIGEMEAPLLQNSTTPSLLLKRSYA